MGSMEKFNLIPLLCTHIYSHMLWKVHPQGYSHLLAKVKCLPFISQEVEILGSFEYSLTIINCEVRAKLPTKTWAFLRDFKDK